MSEELNEIEEIEVSEIDTEEQERVKIYKGATVKGTVMSISENEIRLDLGAKSTGVITRENMNIDNSVKLDEVVFEYPEDFVSKPWIMKDNENRLYLEMTPVVNRHELDNYAIIVSNQNQVFGKFSGYFVLDDGTKVEIEDAYGFAEKVYNKW